MYVSFPLSTVYITVNIRSMGELNNRLLCLNASKTEMLWLSWQHINKLSQHNVQVLTIRLLILHVTLALSLTVGWQQLTMFCHSIVQLLPGLYRQLALAKIWPDLAARLDARFTQMFQSYCVVTAVQCSIDFIVWYLSVSSLGQVLQ